MFNILTTLANALEHTTIKKAFGGYQNAAIIEGNLNLLHKLQDEKLCNSKFIEPEEALITLDMLLGEKKKPEKPEAKSEDPKEAFIKWFNSLDDENKNFIKNALK